MENKKTDNSENHSWNLDNSTGFNMNTTNGKVFIYQYTFAVAEYDADDHLMALIRLNDAGGDMYVEGCYITFYLK